MHRTENESLESHVQRTYRVQSASAFKKTRISRHINQFECNFLHIIDNYLIEISLNARHTIFGYSIPIYFLNRSVNCVIRGVQCNSDKERHDLQFVPALPFLWLFLLKKRNFQGKKPPSALILSPLKSQRSSVALCHYECCGAVFVPERLVISDIRFIVARFGFSCSN